MVYRDRGRPEVRMDQVSTEKTNAARLGRAVAVVQKLNACEQSLVLTVYQALQEEDRLTREEITLERRRVTFNGHGSRKLKQKSNGLY